MALYWYYLRYNHQLPDPDRRKSSIFRSILISIRVFILKSFFRLMIDYLAHCRSQEFDTIRIFILTQLRSTWPCIDH